MFSQERRRRLLVASKSKNSCFTWSIARPAATFTFSPTDALFLNDKVQNSSSSLCLCTWKIIGHPEWCKMARWRDQLTLKVEFTGRPRSSIDKWTTIWQYQLHLSSITGQNDHANHGMHPSPSSSVSTTFRGPDPG